MRRLVIFILAVVCFFLWSDAVAGASVLPEGQSGATWAGANLISTVDMGTVATLAVPIVAASSAPNGQAAVWVGVDGAAGTASLVQTGINLGSPSAGGYSAWWTTCGTWAGGHGCGEQPIQAVVLPGDQIRMAIAHVGSCRWRLSLTDMRDGTRSWWWGSTIEYCDYGPRTLEWVAEGWAPSVLWPTAAPAVFRNIWVQHPEGNWTPARLSPSDELYSNVMQGLAEERSGIPTVCAQGHASASTVGIDFVNPC